MAKHNLLGTDGEAMAAKWLSGKGFMILHQNWRYSHYEVDIIASLDNVLHFIEVKTRRTKTFGEPEDSVDNKKIRNLMHASAAYQEQYPQWKRVQYDVLAITMLHNAEAEYYFIEDIYL